MEALRFLWSRSTSTFDGRMSRAVAGDNFCQTLEQLRFEQESAVYSDAKLYAKFANLLRKEFESIVSTVIFSI